jgi:hypothetical protein
MTRGQVLREIISLKAIIQPTAIRCLSRFERYLSQRSRRFSHGCGLEPDQDAVHTLDQRLRAAVEALQAMRALQEHARRECPHRTVLPDVEPTSRFLHPGHPVGIEDLLQIWERDQDVQALLGGGE